MNFSPDAYNADLPEIGGIDTPDTDQVTDAFETDNTPLLDTLEATDGRQTVLIAISVIGGVGLSLLGINALIGRFENRIARNSVPETEPDVVVPDSADDGQVGRHKTTAALAEQQSHLAQLETSPSELEAEDDVVSPVVSPPPGPRFTPRKVPASVPPVPLPIERRQQQVIAPPISVERLPERPPIIAQPPSRPLPAPLPSPVFSPNRVDTAVDVAIPQAEPISVPPPATVYQTYRVPARLAETITLTQELLDFGVSLPLILQEPLPTMSGRIPAYSECLADVSADSRTPGALILKVTACYQNGQVQPVAPESTMVLSSALTPVRPETLQHQTSVPQSDDLGTTLQETVEQAALSGIQDLAADVLGDDVLGSVARAALEAVTEAAIADDAVPDPTLAPVMPAYHLAQDTQVVVVSRAPVELVAAITPPVVVPDERVVPPAVESLPARVPSVVIPPAPAPMLDVLPDAPHETPPEAAKPQAGLHPDGQPLPTLEQLLEPLKTQQTLEPKTPEALPAASDAERTIVSLNQTEGENNAL